MRVGIFLIPTTICQCFRGPILPVLPNVTVLAQEMLLGRVDFCSRLTPDLGQIGARECFFLFSTHV
jgi:hypothetical protein